MTDSRSPVSGKDLAGAEALMLGTGFFAGIYVVAKRFRAI